MNKKKLVYVSSVAVPLMSKFCEALQPYYDSWFLFYSEAKHRPVWWRKFEFTSRAEILGKTITLLPGKYINLGLIRKLCEIAPDVIILGGFFIPSNYFAYRWAKRSGVKVVIFSEKLGYNFKLTPFKRFNYSKTSARLFSWLYRDVDLVLAVGERGYECFTAHFTFDKKKVIKAYYPVDMAPYLEHPLRNSTPSPTFLFPHRLIELYNPLAALDWFHAIHKKHPMCKFKLNAFGGLRGEVEYKIKRVGLSDAVSFLDDIDGWDSLHRAYRYADIVLSTKSSLKRDGDWSIAEMEACASGLGFIVTNRSLGLTTHLNENSSGFVIEDIRDLDAVVQAASMYITHDHLLASHGETNRNSMTKYSLGNTAKYYARHIDSVLI